MNIPHNTDKTGKQYTIGFIFMLMFLMPGVWADDHQSQPTLSLAERLVVRAVELESDQVSVAITMLLKREAEVVKVSSPEQLAHFYNKLAELNATLGHIVEVKTYAEKGLALHSREDSAVVADLYFNLGFAYEMQADYDTARLYYKKGYAIAKNSGDRLVEGRGKLYLAALATEEQNYEVALVQMKEAYGIALEVNDDGLSWEVFNSLGLLYNYTRDDVAAVDIHLQALATAQAMANKELEIASLYNLAGTYLELKAYSEANSYFDKMLAKSKASTEKSNMYAAYKGFARSSNENKQYERALAYIKKAEEFLPFVEGVMYQVEFYQVKADILSHLDQTNKALEVLSIAEKLMPKDQLNNTSGFGLMLLDLKSRFYADLGQYQRGYELLKEYSDGYEKSRTTQRDAVLGKLRVAFDVERNESLNKILEKDNQIKALQLRQAKSEQQIQTFFLVALTVLSMGLIFVMYRQLNSRRKLKLIAQTDSLTDLYNRGYALAKGEELVNEQGKTKQQISVMLFDLDNFKQVNDTYGHSAGDAVLKNISEVSQSCLRDSDIMARIGGEEFLAILPGVAIETAQLIAERLKEKLAAQQQEFEQNRFSVTASFGVAMAQTGETFEALTQRADKAMYLAKENGRNCVEVACSGYRK
ncbi:MAG: diguanylate cyclase (GGDEF)-like protein [Alteromonadaceae bacterium]|jgi:diguanylate cyclase (GGDEF)-like protein